MSFSKAKVRRFNEIKDCTPSPAKYNISGQEKCTSGIIGRSGLYLKKLESPLSSEAGSVHSTPCFQTPTVPKKKKLLGITFKSTKTTDTEELKDKIVECHNKDLYIKDLIEQLEEMREKISSLQCERDSFQDAFAKLQQKHNNVSLKYTKDYSMLSSSIKKLNIDLQSTRQHYEKQKTEHVGEFNQLLEATGKFKEITERNISEVTKQFEIEKRHISQKVEKYKMQINIMQQQHAEETEILNNKLQAKQAKIMLLEENFKEVNVLTEIQMKEKIKEIDASWKIKLEEQEKEANAILKECQEISEYNIIQSEIEKNQFRHLLAEKESEYSDLLQKYNKLEDDWNNLKSDQHAYELSITTFQDTIEVLKRRLISSDRDVEQLKEELGKSDAKILFYEKKCAELTNQLAESQIFNDELEMQYESTSQIMQNQVIAIEKALLDKVETVKNESRELLLDKKLFHDLLEQHREQQILLDHTQSAITQSTSLIEELEIKQTELETRLLECKLKLDEETGEAAEIRKKYIEKSGRYDALAQQFEQILQELDVTKGKIKQKEDLVESCQKQMEAHSFELEARNFKLNKLVEKLKREVDDLKKPTKKLKVASEDKENLASPKCMKGTQSPVPLKDKN